MQFQASICENKNKKINTLRWTALTWKWTCTWANSQFACLLFYFFFILYFKSACTFSMILCLVYRVRIIKYFFALSNEFDSFDSHQTTNKRSRADSRVESSKQNANAILNTSALCVHGSDTTMTSEDRRRRVELFLEEAMRWQTSCCESKRKRRRSLRRVCLI